MRTDLAPVASWPVELLGEVADITLGGTPSTAVASFWGGSIPWMASGDVNLREVFDVSGRVTPLGLTCSNATLIAPPAVAVGLAGQGRTRGTVAFVHIQLCTNQSIALLQGRPRELDTRYLFHNLEGRYEELRARSSGGGRGGLSRSILSQIPIAIPPISEQRRIVEILDTVDKAIQDTERLISKLNQMKKGLVHDLLTKGIDDNGEVRQSPEEAPHLYKDSPLGQIPSGWELSSLMSRITLPTGQLDPKAEPFRSWVLVAPDHIEVGTGRLMERRSAMEQGAISGKYEFAVGDVVYSKIRPHLRKAMLADFQGLCSADMYPLRPSIDLNSRFLLALVLGEHFSKFAESVSVRSGFPKINRNELAEYRAAFPSRREQDLIAEKFHAIDQCLDREQAQFCKLQTLKRGLMEDLLTGRVRVSDAGAGAP